MQIVNHNHARFQNIVKVLQTGAICKVDNQQFFEKDGEKFFEFAIKYLYADWLNA